MCTTVKGQAAWGIWWSKSSQKTRTKEKWFSREPVYKEQGIRNQHESQMTQLAITTNLRPSLLYLSFGNISGFNSLSELFLTPHLPKKILEVAQSAKQDTQADPDNLTLWTPWVELLGQPLFWAYMAPSKRQGSGRTRSPTHHLESLTNSVWAESAVWTSSGGPGETLVRQVSSGRPYLVTNKSTASRTCLQTSGLEKRWQLTDPRTRLKEKARHTDSPMMPTLRRPR